MQRKYKLHDVIGQLARQILWHLSNPILVLVSGIFQVSRQYGCYYRENTGKSEDEGKMEQNKAGAKINKESNHPPNILKQEIVL